MTNETPHTLMNQLDALLEHERRALLQGDLEAIAALLNRKEALIDALNAQAPGPKADLLSLQGKVHRNQALLDGALEGIRKVAGRISTFRKIRHTLETYDKTGRKQAIQGEANHQIEKRA